VPRWRAIALNALLLVFGLGAALGLLEAFLRVYNPFGERLVGDRIVLPTNYRYVMTNELNRKLPRTIVFSKNSLGFRGPEPPAAFADALSVVAVGGSTTESLYVTDGQTWPEIAGQKLAPCFRALWVNNAGIDGHSTYGHLLLLRQRLAALRPKVALFLVGINDVGREDLKSADRAIVGDGDASWLTRGARRSAILATAQNLLRSREAARMKLSTHADLNLARLPHVEYTGRRPEKVLALHRERFLAPYRERLLEIVRVCRAAGILPVFVTQPALYGPATDDVTHIDLGTIVVDLDDRTNGTLAWQVLELYNDVTRNTGRDASVGVVDLAHRLPKSSRLYYDFIHFTAEGSLAVGTIVADGICAELAARFPDHVRSACPQNVPPAARGEDAGSVTPVS
jgi:lysophospholipase L1-like esterase